MTSEQQIVAGIQKFIASSVQTDTPEARILAERFSEICGETNSRLEQCAEYLKKDMRAEAVSLAESEPQLIELVGNLNFSSAQEWIDFCKLYEWPEPPELRMDILDSLKNAMTEQTSLKPLENEYRRKIHIGSLREKILILRKLKSLDPDNKNWETSLRGFEKVRIDELTSEAKLAIEKNDEKTLLRINSEISSPEWMVKPENKVTAKIAVTLKNFRAFHLRSKGDCILKEISDAYSVFSVKSLNNAIAKWDILCGDSEFQPTDHDLKQVDEAKEWVAVENKKISDVRNFKNLLKQLEDMLDEKGSFNLVENTFSKLKQFEMEIPEILQSRYVKYEQECELSRSRTMKLRTAATLVIIILTAAILVLFINHRVETKLRSDWIAQISQCLKEKKLDATTKLFEKLKESHPKIYVKPELIALHKQLQTMQGEKLQRAQILGTIIESLKKVASEDFQTDMVVDDKIKEAETLAESPDEILELKKIKDAKSAYDNRMQKNKDSKFLADTEELDEICKKIQTVNSTTDSVAFGKLLREYESKLGVVILRPGVSKELYDLKTKILQGRLMVLKKNYEEGLTEYKNFTGSLASLYSRITSISDFRTNVQTFIEKYPDCQQTTTLKKINANMRYYEPVTLIKSFTSEKLTSSAKTAEFKSLSNKIPQDSIWGGEFAAYFQYYETVATESEAVKQFFKSLQEVPLINFYCIRFKDKKGREVEMISEKQPKMTRQSIIAGETMPEYEVLRIMGIKDLSGTFWYVERKPDGWQARVGKEVQMKDLEILNFAEMENKVKDFDGFKKVCLEVSDSASFDCELFFPKLILELKKCKGFPFRRLILIKNILEQAKKISSNRAAYDKLSKSTSEFMESFGVKYDYMNMKIEDQKKVLDFIEELPSLSDETEKTIFKRDLVAKSLDRYVDFIGVVKSSDDGNKNANLKKTNYQGEVWALKTGDDGNIHFIIVGSVKDGTCLLEPGLAKSLLDGEPLFAPMDGKNTLMLAESFRKRAEKLKIELAWPSCWPLNGVK